MKKILSTHKNIIYCICIIFITIIAAISYLVLRKEYTTNDNYFFIRKYELSNIMIHLRKTEKQIKAEVPPHTKRNVINNIVLEDSMLLSFEEVSTNPLTQYAFYIYKISSKDSMARTLVYAPIFSDSYRNKHERSMAYYGNFLTANGYITFTFLHIPYIYIFNENGEFLTTIRTKDNVPSPSIIQYKGYYLYERGKTFNSNYSAFVKDKYLYVLSMRVPKNTLLFTFDLYALSNGQYVGSINIDNGNRYTNLDIEDLQCRDERIFIITKDESMEVLIQVD